MVVVSAVVATGADSGLVFVVGLIDGDRTHEVVDHLAVLVFVADHPVPQAVEAMVDHPHHIAVAEASEVAAVASGAGPRVGLLWATAAALHHHLRDHQCAGAET